MRAIQKNKPISKLTLKSLEELLNGDKDLVLFFLAWLKNGQNATRAYLELNPNVTEHSARVLGSKVLAKISIPVIMSTYGLDHNEYFTKLKEGLNATRTISAQVIVKSNDPKVRNKTATARDVDFIDVPDYVVRKQYHDKVGKLLGIETEAKNPTLNQFNFNMGDEIAKSAKERGLKP